MTEFGYRGPAMDYGLHSPSGKMSKRARAAAMKREGERLFAGCDLNPPIPQPSEAEKLRRHATTLRELADRGFRPRYHRKQAAIAEAKAAQLENAP